MAESGEAERMLIEEGYLPREMAENYTFSKVREVLAAIEGEEIMRLREAMDAARRLEVRGALAAVIFIRHHLEGEHEVEVDRISESEDGERFGVLIYPDGELPIAIDRLPFNVEAGARLRYDPEKRGYELIAEED